MGGWEKENEHQKGIFVSLPVKHLNFCFESQFHQAEKIKSWTIQDSSLLSQGVVAKFWGFQSDIMRREEAVVVFFFSHCLFGQTPPEDCSFPSGQSPSHFKPLSLSASLEREKHLVALSQDMGHREMPELFPILSASPCSVQYAHHSGSCNSVHLFQDNWPLPFILNCSQMTEEGTF